MLEAETGDESLLILFSTLSKCLLLIIVYQRKLRELEKWSILIQKILRMYEVDDCLFYCCFAYPHPDIFGHTVFLKSVCEWLSVPRHRPKLGLSKCSKKSAHLLICAYEFWHV